jgi:predicted RNA-binding Zn-ribbon protein involved in translation (DUF1610 family)
MKANTEAESTSAFLRYRQGRTVFRFLCPVCGCDGELGVLAGHSRNGLVACPENCGAFFIVRLANGLFAKPSLEFALGPARGRRRPKHH